MVDLQILRLEHNLAVVGVVAIACSLALNGRQHRNHAGIRQQPPHVHARLEARREKHRPVHAERRDRKLAARVHQRELAVQLAEQLGLRVAVPPARDLDLQPHEVAHARARAHGVGHRARPVDARDLALHLRARGGLVHAEVARADGEELAPRGRARVLDIELDRLLLGRQDCALHADAPRRWTAKRRARVRHGQRLQRAAAATARRARALYIARRVHRVARGPGRVDVPPSRWAPGRAERDARQRAAGGLREHEHGVHRAARPRLARGQAVVGRVRGGVVVLARRARRRAHAAHAPGARVQIPKVLCEIRRARCDRVRLGRVTGHRVDRKAPRLQREARRRRALEADARALHQHERRALLGERLAREVRGHRAVHRGLVARVLAARLALADHKHRIQIVLCGRAGDVGRPREHAELVAVAR